MQQNFGINQVYTQYIKDTIDQELNKAIYFVVSKLGKRAKQEGSNC